MRTLFSTCLFLLFANQSLAQNNISGIINDYAKVLRVDYCENYLLLDNAAPFNASDKVLIVQMKGAQINTANTSNYGNIDDYGPAGNYEFLTISTKNGDTLFILEMIQQNYSIGELVQIVSVPIYANATIVDTLSCQSWNGHTGGILVFECVNLLTFNAPIDVSAKGFRGGAYFNHTQCFAGGIGGYGGYRCVQADFCGGTKGEGISVNNGFTLGRGPNANGGGGGNDHNTGGGGGSNAGIGGEGGNRLLASQFSCPGPNPGIGGRNLDYLTFTDRLFMGGGGGNGDQNNNEGGIGGRSGGIALIIANQIDGNNMDIFANGAQPNLAHYDAGGGGGAGGTVHISSNAITDSLYIIMNGGTGGNVDNGNDPNDHCYGPGGGGGGGMLWLSSPILLNNLDFQLAGGTAGLTINANAPAACLNSSNGATTGSEGFARFDFVLPENNSLHQAFQATASNDTSVCNGVLLNLSSEASSSSPISYAWNNGATTQQIQFNAEQTATYSIWISTETGCVFVKNIDVTVSEFVGNLSQWPDSILQPLDSVLINAPFNPHWSYEWVDSNNLIYFNEDSAYAAPLVTSNYCAIITDTLGCINLKCIEVMVAEIDTQVVEPPTVVVPAFVIPDAFTPNGDGENDLFRIFTQGEWEVQQFKIFNRWGKLVHEHTSAWDGMFKNVEQPMGVYVYQIVLKEEKSGNIFDNIQGTFTLVR